MTFAVRNAAGEPVTLTAAWLPHGRFRATECALEDTPTLAPGEARTFHFPVAFDEAPGATVENAFVIFRVSWWGEEWRVLARLTVTAGSDCSPQARAQRVTVQPVGFSR